MPHQCTRHVTGSSLDGIYCTSVSRAEEIDNIVQVRFPRRIGIGTQRGGGVVGSSVARGVWREEVVGRYV